MSEGDVVVVSKGTASWFLFSCIIATVDGDEEVVDGNSVDAVDSNGTRDGLLEDNVDADDDGEVATEPVVLSSLFWSVVVEVDGNLVESVAKTVVPVPVLEGFFSLLLFRSTPEETLIISKVVGEAAVVVLWLWLAVVFTVVAAGF